MALPVETVNTTVSRDPKCNRPNTKMKTTVVQGVLTSYELMLAILFRGGVFDRAATISCGSDAVTDPVMGWRIISVYQGEMASCGNGTITTMATR
jgi:hypothetical protein